MFGKIKNLPRSNIKPAVIYKYKNGGLVEKKEKYIKKKRKYFLEVNA